MVRQLKVKIISLALIAASFIGLIAPVNTKALNFGSNIGTSAGLGSPLLNEASWETEDWDPWELVTFGVFCSNFPIPFLDDYQSAFQVGHGGSEGRGFEALKFGASSDAQSEKILKSMLAYSIGMQSKSLTKIKVAWHDIDVDNKFNDTVNGKAIGEWKDEDGQDAQVKNLFFDKVGDSSEGYANVSETGEQNIDSFYGNAGIWNNHVNITYAKKMRLPELYIVSGGTVKTVFDYRDGYDLQTFSALVINAINNNKYGSTVKSNVDSFKDYGLYLDSFGNIVANSGSKVTVIVPACNNQHLTKDKRYNLLTSTYMQGNYIQYSGNSLINSAYGQSGAGAAAAQKQDYDISSSLICKVNDNSIGGKTIAFSDSSLIYFEEAKNKIKSGESSDKAFEDLIKSDFSDISAGNNITDLVNKRITKDSLNGVKFKIEPIAAYKGSNIFDSAATWLGQDSSVADSIPKLVIGSGLVSNWYPMNTNVKVLNSIFTYNGASQLLGGRDGRDVTYLAPNTNEKEIARYTNYALKYLDVNKTSAIDGGDYAIPKQADFFNTVKSTKTLSALATALYTNESTVDNTMTSLATNRNPFTLYTFWENTVENKDKVTKKFNDNEMQNVNTAPMRIGAVYQLNSNMQTAINVLGVVEGTEFASFTPWIYLSYLDFYGIIDGQSAYDEALFANKDVYNTSAEKLFEGAVLGEEEKKAAITDYTFKLLDPQAGKEYRQELVDNFLEQFIVTEYNRIAFGSDSVKSGTVSTNSQSNFLKMHSIYENVIVGILAKFYVQNIVLVILVVLLLSTGFSILSGKGLGGIFGGVLLMLIASLMLPVTVDMLPYVCNNIVQGMFSPYETYWSVSQEISNQQVTSKSVGAEDDADAAEVDSYIKMLSLNQLDRTLFIKNDISKKIVENIEGIDYSELQRLKSTQWLLPVLLRQVSQQNGKADYVSVPVGDALRNAMSIYWYYRDSNTDTSIIQDIENNNNIEADLIKSMEPGESNTMSGKDIASVDTKKAMFEGYKDTSIDDNDIVGINYDHHAKSRIKDDTSNVHTYFYLLGHTGLDIPDPVAVTGSEELNTETWNKYAEYIKSNSSNSRFDFFKNKYFDTYVNDISNYNFYNNPVQQEFGYTWMTENTIPYFYASVKDSFDLSQSLGQLIYLLQGRVGTVYVRDEYGEETDQIYVDRFGRQMENTHKSFMIDYTNGQIKDFLDMQEMFTNVIPYMYNLQVLTAGNDDGTGILGDGYLGTDYPVYKDNKKYWLFRCNWVTKIVENRYYAGKQTIGYIDADGKHLRATINGGLDPSNYSKYRDMVFSEAQMEKMGLTEKDLSNVETSILKVNAATEEDWTLLLNYANVNNMKAEVLYRQMALIASMNFNKEFSGGNSLTSRAQLYPVNLDLRNLSFDAVMKLIVLSATNAPVTTSSTVIGVLSTSGLLAAIVLLLDALLIGSLLMFFRDLAVAVLTIMLLHRLIVKTISNEGKATVLLGTLFTYIKYGIMTVLYYSVFSFLMVVSAPDEVLHKANILSKSTGVVSVYVQLFVVLIATLAYIFAIIRGVIVFSWEHPDDMGFEAHMSMIRGVIGRTKEVASGVGRFRESFSKRAKETSASSSGGSSINPFGSSSGFGSSFSKSKANSSSESDDDDTKSSKRSRKSSDGSSGASTSEAYKGKSGYTNVNAVDTSRKDSDAIDKMIQNGEAKQSGAGNGQSQSGGVVSEAPKSGEYKG